MLRAIHTEIHAMKKKKKAFSHSCTMSHEGKTGNNPRDKETSTFFFVPINQQPIITMYSQRDPHEMFQLQQRSQHNTDTGEARSYLKSLQGSAVW